MTTSKKNIREYANLVYDTTNGSIIPEWIEEKYKVRVERRHGGGVGIQTHGNKLAKALNTQTPDHSVYLNEDNYLKGGIKIRS